MAMEEDDISLPDSPAIESGHLSPDSSAFEKQRAALQTYLDSVPYKCETIEEMQSVLEEIVGKIVICARAKNWLVLATWDGMLQCWLLLRYPMSKSIRARLVTLYYELCLVPGLEPRVIRSWADMLNRLLANKPDQRRKLEIGDLVLEWQPLWRVLQKELWPKKRLQESSRNMINILLFIAEHCSRYYCASEIPDMLHAFLPMVTNDTILTMVPVIVSFLPPTHTHLYLPLIFKLWEAFNSGVIDDRFLEVCGDLSEEHIAGPDGDAGPEGGAKFKDVGMWSHAEWTMLVGKTLASMNVPVGSIRGASTTAGHADSMGDKQSLRIRKQSSRFNSLAKLFVYSMSLDSPIRGEDVSDPNAGCLAGSQALDSLDKLITSTESYFHPSNTGHWTIALTSFLHRLTTEFCKRWKEEEQSTCKTPVPRRLTPAIRRAFVTTLRTPALLAMFAKDPISSTYAQGSLRSMALLQPNLIMPELLERAYNGLEVINETHRTTTVLTMLSGVALPLVSEKIWPAGQKHVVPLLELSIPGIDLNDPIKTLCASMFIIAVSQHIKIGDLSMQQGGVPMSDDAPPDELMEVDDDEARLPVGTEMGFAATLSREEERALTRESTAAFADWVTSLFRRVFALLENLPEEGGKRNTTGGKMEEAVLKSIKSTLDVVCLHLSDQLFDLVLNLVYDYATTNAKSNAVRAFGQLVACLARVKPDKVIARFLPFCVRQIQEELKHGASSIRTTSTHSAVPSDTTLHWNMSILRGCLGYGGPALLKYKEQFIELLSLLIDKTKSERGYSGTGRLISRILHTVAGVYPINARFVNSELWDDPEFNRNHNFYWGKLYKAEDVKAEWHTPSSEEIDFVVEVLDRIAAPALAKLEALLEDVPRWDSVSRNDFCRYLHAVRSVWGGLPTIYREGHKEVKTSCLHEETEVEGMLVSRLSVAAGFALEDPNDPRYQKVVTHRQHFGAVIHRAAIALRQGREGEDHIDAVIGVSKAIDVYLLEYAMTRGTFDSMQKTFAQTRELSRMWPRQKDNTRAVFLKRAQVYHSGRVYLDALYRRRSEFDDLMLEDLIELSLSPYTRVRRHAQAVLQNACGYYLRSTRFCLPYLFRELGKGVDPDRMKGALYVLWNKGIAAYALADATFSGQYLTTLLGCQHQEKPSIQKLVGGVVQDALSHLAEEGVHTTAFTESTDRLDQTLKWVAGEFSPKLVDNDLLSQSVAKSPARIVQRNRVWQTTVSEILEIALRPATHWRYVQFAARFLYGLLRRDVAPPPEMAKFFIDMSISPHPTIRSTAQKAIVRLTGMIKIRTYSKSGDELWWDEWKSPLRKDIPVVDSPQFYASLIRPPGPTEEPVYVDKLTTGFLAWGPSIKTYRAVASQSPFQWEAESQPALEAIRTTISSGEFYSTLATLLGQESTRNPTVLELRGEHVMFMKSLAKMFEYERLDELLAVLEPLLTDPDRFRQRAGAELLAGLLRGSKHWTTQKYDHLWSWMMSRINRIFAQIKPDTLSFWENMFNEQLSERDYRRVQPLINWILSLPLEFHGDSAFAMTKTLTLFNVVADCSWSRFYPVSDHYMNLFFDNANTGYAEIRTHIAQNLAAIISCQWRPSYPTPEAFLRACVESNDPLGIRDAKYLNRVNEIARQLPIWKEQRLPPPRVSQSQYDKVGLTILQWIWSCSHGSHASLMFPYIVALLPEILRMSELNDSAELQKYSSAVLYVLSAVAPPADYIEVIADNFIDAIKSSGSWRIRVNALPTLIVFFYRNLMNMSSGLVTRVMDALLDCLADENVEVREMASKMLSGLVRCSQRQSIIPLKDRFVKLARKTKLPSRRDPSYADALRSLHSAILGLCALIESFPYSVEPWMPALTDILANHASDPAPISTTIRKCASEFKKTHQDTWHKDQLAFDEDQLQSLSSMLVGTSYYA
ncbi:ARM repeat-containing protein [Cristinia sonorae]|uniref:ARM repeat-containing protein n=1 Tax=Cristinia sonorae TaxID=1940300 RepID=A0A8K0UMQ8_9AGAR|nr:ARM repeat-containing protein [Cristinia sonorae]